MKKTIGVIGAGRWGRNYLRTFNELGCRIKWVCSTRDATLKEALADTKVAAKTTKNYREILEDNEVDAVAIAAPSSMHYRLAKESLQSGKHVLVEKPIAFSSKNVEELIRISGRKNRILMAGHQQLFNPGVQKMKEDIGKGMFGKINFINSVHFGNGPIRADMSALWDFFPHSVSILIYLLGKSPVTVSASGKSFINKGIEDIATMDAVFPDNVFSASIGSWMYPVKKMEIVVAAEKLYASFDDCAQAEKLKYYCISPNAAGGKISIKDKGFKVPKISNARPLTEELKHFLDCIEKNMIPITGGEQALKVTKVLEAAQKSLNRNGQPVKVK
ncbi:Gfo/Idh/MocA family oxidoreductase [Candidatus Woesearchaeota archaeon]|nr:Gfo/Idh/MocA family oxidoreductase [Candidatus Woesearchaeota archaeon]